MTCKTYDINTLQDYKYVVVLSKYKGKILLSRHKGRSTWETQGGHIESGETPLEAARRELYEESGAVEFDIIPLCDYGSGNSNGAVFVADIYKLGELPDSEMEEVREFDVLPENLTYPAITPILFAKIGCYRYKKATIVDINELVKTRITVLRAANKLSHDVDMSHVEQESYGYYQSALKNDNHVGYLVYDIDELIGAGGVSYYQVMPTFHNPTGKKAYIMNMYTEPEYRRKGIAIRLLDLLVQDAKQKGIDDITLEATEMGRPLYEKYGFVQMQGEMELRVE